MLGYKLIIRCPCFARPSSLSVAFHGWICCRGERLHLWGRCGAIGIALRLGRCAQGMGAASTRGGTLAGGASQTRGASGSERPRPAR